MKRCLVHARDPYTRVDVLPSSRHNEVESDGITVADSSNALVLFETGLPVRYYLPKTDVCMDLLTPTETRSHCPYKGTAEYWTVTVNSTDHEDFAWSCRTPLAESARIGGIVGFYNKKVDHIIDGDLVERPTTIFS